MSEIAAAILHLRQVIADAQVVVGLKDRLNAAADRIEAATAPRPGFAAECTRVYTRRGRVAHLRPPFGHQIGSGVLCPVLPAWPDEFLGTGSQREYERAASLPLCFDCAVRAAGENAYRAEPSQFTPVIPAARLSGSVT
jgi:hypothetical protein